MNKLMLKNMKYLMKQNSKHTMGIILAGLMLLLGSCGESVDPALSDIKLEMKATTQLSTINTNARVANTGIEFTEVLIGVTEIEFESLEESQDDGGNDSFNDVWDDDGWNDDSDNHNDDSDNHDSDEYEIEFEGQFIVDLLKGTSNPDFGIADIAPGIYKELEVRVSPIMDDGNSIVVKFNYQPEGMDPVSVEYSTNKEIKFEIENSSGIKLDGNALTQILILFDLDRLFAGIDLSIAVTDTDGIIRINSTSNMNLAALLWQNLDHAFEAGEDQDGDHDIDDDHSDDD